MPGPVFLAGERVSLHTVEEDDLDAFARARSDPEVRIPLGIDSPGNRDTLESFFEETVSNDDGYWFVVSDGEETVGAVMLPSVDDSSGVGDLDYWILPEHRGDGYGSEAVSLLLQYGFDELRLHRVRADCSATNEDAKRLLESLGFTREGRFREAIFRRRTHEDVLRYGLLADERRAK